MNLASDDWGWAPSIPYIVYRRRDGVLMLRHRDGGRVVPLADTYAGRAPAVGGFAFACRLTDRSIIAAAAGEPRPRV